jgi:hypothetical protein
MPGTGLAQLPIQKNTPGYYDFTIPSGINGIKVTVQGASGGGTEIEFGGYCPKRGGSGARLVVRFLVGISCNFFTLESGGILRTIDGEQGEEQNHSASASGRGGGGGGGSALLYKKPGSDNWVVLVVAGGGGGLSRMPVHQKEEARS